MVAVGPAVREGLAALRRLPPPRRVPAAVSGAVERLPLRTRLLAVVVLLLVAAMTLTGLVSLGLLRGQLQDRVDTQLTTTGENLSDAVVGIDLGRGQRQVLPSEFYVQASTSQGEVVGAITQLTQHDGSPLSLDLPPLTAEFADRQDQRPFTVEDAAGDGSDWRVVVYSYPERGVTTAVALSLDDVDRTVDTYRYLVLLVSTLVVALGTVLAALAIRRAFRPLAQIEVTASAIADGDLSQRVPPAAPGTEVGRLATALNSMLSHVERAFRARQRSEEQMRRFVADASHELRTPLAAIRGFAELHRLGALPERADVTRAMERIEAESTRLGRLVDDLLVLARLDEAQRQAREQPEPVDLAVLASDAVHDARALAPERHVRLVGLPEGAPVRPTAVLAADAGLRQVLTNLVGNALHHTPAGTPVEVAVGPVRGPSGPEAVVEVRDHGAGLAPEDAERVFERFYRVDASRRRGTGGGSGLGLAIVKSIVEGHGGTVAVAATPGGGATFRLRFRLAAPEEDAEEDAGEDAEGGSGHDATGYGSAEHDRPAHDLPGRGGPRQG
ncbi:HAMP domain-containing sensor histidine kinase [Kineococcus glutinatus]|uniref:histidine kinase n=1 Tax=Kineococcus glutinatus TaxID=1070872 RepID=A0ABP9H6G8_9ACTN